MTLRKEILHVFFHYVHQEFHEKLFQVLPPNFISLIFQYFIKLFCNRLPKGFFKTFRSRCRKFYFSKDNTDSITYKSLFSNSSIDFPRIPKYSHPGLFPWIKLVVSPKMSCFKGCQIFFLIVLQNFFTISTRNFSE